MGSHGAGVTLCPGTARAPGRTRFATVTLWPREPRVPSFALEARRTHHPWWPGGAGVTPQPRLAVLAIQSFQTSRALDAWRSRGSGGPWHPCGPPYTLAALLCCRSWRPSGANLPWEAGGARWPWEAGLALETLIAFLTSTAWEATLTPRSRWPCGAGESIQAGGARFPLLPRWAHIASFTFDALKEEGDGAGTQGMDGTWGTAGTWRVGGM